MAETKSKKGITTYSITGENAGEAAAAKGIFDKTVSPELLAQYVRVYQTNKRQGNASTKTRAEVAGTTKKMYKQKGTGRARHGSYKAPIFKGGGVVGGPQPKEYRLSMNKKQKKLALFGALTLKYTAGDVLSLGGDVKEAKTKTFASFLKKLELTDKKVLFVTPVKDEENISLSLRNIAKVKFMQAHSVNAYEVLDAAKVVFVGDALKELETHYLNQE